MIPGVQRAAWGIVVHSLDRDERLFDLNPRTLLVPASVGKIVALADSKGLELKKLPLSDLKSAEKRITQEVYAALDVAGSVKSRTSYRGTAPANVKREAKKWIKRLEKGAETR